MTWNDTMYNSYCHDSADETVKVVRPITQPVLSKKPLFGGSFDVVEKINDMHFLDTVQIVRVMYKNPVTVVFWSDNTRTVAKCNTGDTYNAETGLQVAILKKIVGNGRFRDTMHDWLPEQINLFGEANISISDVRKKHKN